MLDVAISLALVYLMMAGLVSGLQELLASALQLRGKQLQRGIASLLHEAMVTEPAPGSLLAGFYAHPLIDALRDGDRRPSYIPANSFALVLADQLVTAEGVNQPLFAGLPEAVARMPASPLKATLQVLVQQAAGRAEALQALVEQHFNDVMSRVSGWYKRQAQWIAFALALSLSVVMNVDSVGIVRYLTAHPEISRQLAEQAAQKVAVQANAQTPEAAGTPSVDALAAKAAQDARTIVKQLGGTGLPLGWPQDPQTGRLHWPDSGVWALLGWLVTALAATLGAPFWFDLISRLVPLRGSGKPPGPAAAPPAAPTPAAPTPAVSPTTPPAPAPLAATTPAASAGPRNDFEARQLNEVDLRALQAVLGLNAAAISGLLDEPTRQALRQWQLNTHRPASGEFDADTVMALLYPDLSPATLPEEPGHA